MSMASISNWGFNFVVVFAFPLLLAGSVSPATFTIFAIICIGGIVFTLARVPETTGHSLEAIESAPGVGPAAGRARRAIW